jgi:hypothetical protein
MRRNQVCPIAEPDRPYGLFIRGRATDLRPLRQARVTLQCQPHGMPLQRAHQ